jgi:tyrosyl-tRNA synthetase
MANGKEISELLTRGVAEVIGRDHLEERLRSGEKLRVKFGIDPTSPNLHIGRAVALLKLRDFQDLGHQVVFLVGDFTAVIGDTSDKDSERPMLQRERVEENMKTYMDQAAKILDMSKVETYYNSRGLEKLGYREIGEQADQFSLAELIARENIKKRLDAGKRVSLRELLYPLMQGYDSVALRADVELGGIDQRFNLLAGRTLQAHYGQKPQDILMVNLILGTDGRKMSSSWGNTINLLDAPNDMFGKIMSIPDELIVAYLIHCTRVPMEEIESMREEMETGANPRDAKLRLAKEIVRMYHGEREAEGAEAYFVAAFSKREIPQDIPGLAVAEGAALVQVLVDAGLASSKGDAKRKIEQGGVEIGGSKVTGWSRTVTVEDDGKVLKVGKKDFRRLAVERPI